MASVRQFTKWVHKSNTAHRPAPPAGIAQNINFDSCLGFIHKP